MAGQIEQDDEGINGINVTPLVDVTLVLLIIFMVTASYIVKETIEIELPRAAHGGETVQKTFALLVTKDGQTYLNGAAVDERGGGSEAERRGRAGHRRRRQERDARDGDAPARRAQGRGRPEVRHPDRETAVAR